MTAATAALPPVLLLPGLHDSGPEHWQSRWERRGFRRVRQADWEKPRREDWVVTLDAEVAAAGPRVLLVAHSLACCLVAHWSRLGRAAGGALLVAPSDVEAPSYPPGTTGFAPMPLERLPFPSIVVASTDDPYVGMARARAFAEAWGSRLVEVGPRGHLNSASGLGEWEEGLELLRELSRSRA